MQVSRKLDSGMFIAYSIATYNYVHYTHSIYSLGSFGDRKFIQCNQFLYRLSPFFQLASVPHHLYLPCVSVYFLNAVHA